MEGMISTRTYGLIELVLTFGGVVVFCVYQIWSVRRPDRRAAAEPTHRTSGEDDTDADQRSSREDQAPDGRRGMR